MGNMFHIRNFFCLFSLRAGTLFTLHLIMVVSSFTLMLLFNMMKNSDLTTDPWVLFLLCFTFVNTIIPGCTLWHFPEMNKKYDKNSVNAKCTKYFYMYNRVMAVMGILFGFFISLFYTRRIEPCVKVLFFSTTWTSLFLHFTAVAYSFHVSILKPDYNESQEYEELATNNLNISMQTQNWNPSSNVPQSKPHPPPKLIDGECSSGGNVYVELPQ